SSHQMCMSDTSCVRKHRTPVPHPFCFTPAKADIQSPRLALTGGGSAPCPRLLDPRFRGCNPIGIDEHGHDFDMSLSRCPGESRDPCFDKSLSLKVFCDRAPRESPRRLRYGSRPAPGRRDMQRRAMNANWITPAFAGVTGKGSKLVPLDQPRPFLKNLPGKAPVGSPFSKVIWPLTRIQS